MRVRYRECTGGTTHERTMAALVRHSSAIGRRVHATTESGIGGGWGFVGGVGEGGRDLISAIRRQISISRPIAGIAKKRKSAMKTIVRSLHLSCSRLKTYRSIPTAVLSRKNTFEESCKGP